MKKVLLLIVSALALFPAVFAVNVGSGIGIDIKTEDFIPEIWLCDSRAVLDDSTEPGRMSLSGEPLAERIENYAFEGEQISWTVLVMDKNGIQKVRDVFVSIGDHRTAREMVPFKFNDTACMSSCQSTCNSCKDSCVFFNQTTHQNQTNQTCVNSCNNQLPTCQHTCERIGQRLEQNAIEANCVESQLRVIRGVDEVQTENGIDRSCNARILEEKITEFDDDIMRYYDCTLSIETPLSMYGEYFVTIEVEDIDGMYNFADEVEYWFLNPEVALTVDGDLVFEDVRPGTHSYSSTLLVGNDADDGSGVLMDMFISGTDFYDSQSSGAACPDTNQLRLGNGNSRCESTDPFCYFATKGGYSTQQDPRRDAEGYVGIDYGIGFNDPNPFYNNNEVIQGPMLGPYYIGNILTPGAEMAVTFRLNLPEPCNGDFDSGSLFFWAEAI